MGQGTTLCQEEGQTCPAVEMRADPVLFPPWPRLLPPPQAAEPPGGGGGEQVWAPLQLIRKTQEAENSRSCLPSDWKGRAWKGQGGAAGQQWRGQEQRVPHRPGTLIPAADQVLPPGPGHLPGAIRAGVPMSHSTC